jgi:peptidoglycan hydrolase FlgJ
MRISPEVMCHLPTIEAQKQDKLADAAQQFEASMLQELLKPMQHGQNSWSGDEKSDDSASETISSFGTESMAKAIARGGGFGIARQVISKVALEQQKNSEKKTSKY